jgi:hypothetical protein
MSIAAISSSFVSAVRERAAPAPVDAVAAPRAAAQPRHEGGRRHELVDAMKDVLGVDGATERSDDQAVFRFAHALMHDLRSIDGGGEREGPGRGHAWGRRAWSDLSQRIDALATATATPAAGSPAAPVEPSVEAPTEPVPLPEELSTPPASLPVPVAASASAESPEPEMPLQPNPITTTSAALHLMQVPSSRLLEAYAALREALGDQADAPASADVRADLAAFLARLSASVAVDAPAALPSGSVLNLSA